MSTGPGPDSELIRTLYERFEAGDTDTAFSMLAPDCEFHQNPEFPGPRIHRGRDGFRAGLATFLREWEDFRFRPTEFEEGSRVWMRVMIGGRGRASGIPLDQEVFHVWDVRDGVPYRCRVFLDEQESRREAGLAD